MKKELMGERLKEKRTEKGLTQEEVAEIIGISRQAIGNYEKGIISPSIEIMIKLADLYETTIDYLTGRNIRMMWKAGYIIGKEKGEEVGDKIIEKRKEKKAKKQST